MTIDEIKKELIELQRDDDTQIGHNMADNILCNLLVELGYEDVVNEYKLIHKWYA